MADITFADYWYAKQRKNPSLVNAGKMTISVASFKAELKKAFDAGRISKPSSRGSDLLDDILGGLGTLIDGVLVFSNVEMLWDECSDVFISATCESCGAITENPECETDYA